MFYPGWPVEKKWSLIVAAIILMVATTYSLVHWHETWNPQDCQICHVRHLTGTEPATGLGSPAHLEISRFSILHDSADVSDPGCLTIHGRAPPSFSRAI